MTIHADPTRESVEQLAAAFNRGFETLDAPDDVFTPDVFFDLLPPFWRFQVQGREAIGEQLRAIASPPVTARVLRVVPTATGFKNTTGTATFGGAIGDNMVIQAYKGQWLPVSVINVTFATFLLACFVRFAFAIA